ncbi:MAG: disulfide bond formation protein B [Gemmatimonadota bacterium]|nr:disulfide bond formation protein B [Gemmatimonadota bacterium]
MPCVLCWYQRIAMYPLVVVLGVGMVRGDASVWRYGLPLAVIGAGIAAYHVGIQLQPALDVGVCSAGASCTGRYLNVFGFVSIPVMAGGAFLLVASLMALVAWIERGAADPG